MFDNNGPRATIHFPIEGQSPWVAVLRVVALGSFCTMLVVGGMLFAFDDMGAHLPLVLGGLAAFLLLEYAIIRAVIVPRLADYGRFRLYAHKVDYYPLDITGLAVSTASDSEPLSAFAGITVKAQAERGRYHVYLMHRERGRSLCLKTYTAPEPANSHAEALAETLRVGYAPLRAA